MRKSRAVLFVSFILTLLSTIVFISQLGAEWQQTYIETLKAIEVNNCDYNDVGEDEGGWIDYSENWNGEILVLNDPRNEIFRFTDEYRMKMISKGLHPLNLKHKYLQDRTIMLDKYCNVFLTSSKGKYKFAATFYQMRFSDKSQLLQCVVLKVSSTTWLEVLRDLEGIEKGPLPKDLDDPLWEKISFHRYDGDSKRIAQRYQTYTKFLITRNPFQRLFSAYTDKFITRFEYGENYYVEEIIYVNYLSNISRYSLTQMRKELRRGENKLTSDMDGSIIQQISRMDAGYGKFNITFLEFLNYLISNIRAFGFEDLDDHWKPISKVCDPCSIRYDIIAKFETLREDSQAILDYVQIINPENKVTFPQGNPTVTIDRCNEAFRDIPLNVRRSLYEIFKEDFHLFGYEYREKDENSNFC